MREGDEFETGRTIEIAGSCGRNGGRGQNPMEHAGGGAWRNGAALTDPMTYRDAIYGMSRQARRLRDELESLMDWLEERERA